MEKQPAPGVCPKARNRSQIDWETAGDHTLVGGVVAHDERATLEFLGRFDSLLTKRIRATLMQASFALATTDLIESIKNEVHTYLMTGHMKPLRAFDSRHGTLANWMSRLGHACAKRKLEDLSNLPTDDE